MPSKRNTADADRPRIAPNTIVGWFEGLTEHTGRVLLNIPGTQWNEGAVLVKDTNGVRRSIRVSRLHIKKCED